MERNYSRPAFFKWMPVLLLAAAPFTFGQTKEFEVASVKPHKDDDGRVGIQMAPGGRWRATNVPVNLLLQIAYDLRPGQMTGAPNWINTERYDIDAKVDDSLGPSPKPEQMRPYLQALIEKRFQLKYHHETKDMQVYILEVGKNGSKMKESDPAEVGPRIRMGHGSLTCTKIKMDMFARELSRQVGRPVLNQTGLTGDYNLDLSFAPEGPGGDGGPGGGGDHGPGGPGGGPGGPGGAPGGDLPTVFTAVQEQLGLKLDSKKSPVELFVIDKIEKAEEN
ncbi:MAG TPA: TIGR03435 family protein [Bryobacteraceae bacterium]|jgi:uncharacterized protein (TIGR03435 family)